MNAQLAPEDLDTEPAPDGARALLRSVVITDLCDSTAHVDALGDVRATELIRAHDRLLRGLIREHRGQEIDKTDGFLSLFERPIQAVAFALAYQRGLRAFSLEHGVELKARIGVHVGEVMTWQNDQADVAKGAKPTEVEGLAKPVAARLMGMALPGQILLSGVAYTLAHRAEGELGAALSRVQWKAHGDFRFKGVAEAVPVYEIGEEGLAPFKAPAWSGKAHREVPLWRRPAMLAFEALVLLLVVALPAWQLLKSEPAIAFAERDWVVLADLRNLTGDPRFDDSLEQAFRIGLEQSRHVNVLSDLQVRDTLQRMQRDSDSPVDRSIGAEIAMREGARALVLPTLAEVGGRLRFTAEVVDPTTHATVHADYSDGSGADAVLALVDEVNRKLRERLGESLTEIARNSQPLEKVATADLDALRSYSRAIELVDQRRDADAIGLLQRALEIDPGFSRAHLDLGILRYLDGKSESASEHFSFASEHPGRLSNRELRLTQAWQATLTASQADAIEKWKLLDLEYPEFFAASGALAWHLALYRNDYAAAREALERNTNEKNPRRGHGLLLLGHVRTASGDFEGASHAFQAAASLGVTRIDPFLVRVHAARGDFRTARELIANASEFKSDESRALLAVLGSALELDAGATRLAVSGLEDTLNSMNSASFWARGVLTRAHSVVTSAAHAEATSLSDGLDYSSKSLGQLAEKVSTVGGASSSTELTEALQSVWVDRLLGRTDSAATHVTAVKNALKPGAYADVDHWLTVLEAEDLLQAGESRSALVAISTALGDTESVAARFVAARAQLATGEAEQALSSARSLSLNRGKAYAELWSSHWMLPVNILMSNFGQCLETDALTTLGADRIAEQSIETPDFKRRESGSDLIPDTPPEHICSTFRRLAASSRSRS